MISKMITFVSQKFESTSLAIFINIHEEEQRQFKVFFFKWYNTSEDGTTDHHQEAPSAFLWPQDPPG